MDEYNTILIVKSINSYSNRIGLKEYDGGVVDPEGSAAWLMDYYDERGETMKSAPIIFFANITT